MSYLTGALPVERGTVGALTHKHKHTRDAQGQDTENRTLEVGSMQKVVIALPIMA